VQQLGSSAAHNACNASGRTRWNTFIPRRCETTRPAPGVDYRDWKLDDPAGQPLDVVRPIRDDIAARVRTLIDELLPATTNTA
jgi:hypothetical protein